MSQLELLRLVLQNLRGVGCDSMLVGSYASSYYGEARSTHDVDLVVNLPPELCQRFIDAFDRDRYYLSETAFAERRLANVIDTYSGDKIDLFFLQDDEDSRREFMRRVAGRVFDVEVDIATPEDAILSKLRWETQIGGSEQQQNDVRNILRACGDRIDRGYLLSHSKSTTATLKRILKEIDKE